MTEAEYESIPVRPAEDPELLQALGNYLLASSHLEETIAIAYMSALARLDVTTRYVVMHNVDASTMVRNLARIVKTPLFERGGPHLQTNWKAVEKRLHAAFERRNQIMHGQLASHDVAGRLPFSVRSIRWDPNDRGEAEGRSVTRESLAALMSEADILAVAVRMIGESIREVVASDDYYLNTPIGMPPQEATGGGHWVTV